MPDGGRLHPRLTAILQDEGWTGLTPAQEAALPPLLARRHTLLVAPTGYGKTEAAMLPLLHHLLRARDRLEGNGERWPPGFKLLYITPLRALNRDLLGRLESWGERLGLPVGVRHGDTSQAERSRQSRKPPDILITTPETLQLMLYGDTLRRHLGTVQAVIVDEVHDLAVSERGAQLTIALERVEEVVAQPQEMRLAKARDRKCPKAPHAPEAGAFLRVGLSATVADPDAVAHFLGGAGRAVEPVIVEADKEVRLDVVHPAPDARLGSELSLPAQVAGELHVVRDLVAEHERVIVFQNTRDGAELLTSRSALLDGQEERPPLLELHHGSLSADHRQDVEERFKQGQVKALVATSSLELGIDVGAIDHIVQIHSPRSIARMVQRLGRSGHRVGAVSSGTLVSAGPEDHLECVAVARMAASGVLEPLRIREQPLVVLANQLVALTNEYAALDPDWTRAVIQRAAPFADLDEGMFQEVWDTLLDVETVFPDAGGTYARGGRSRRHFLSHISLIPDERTYRIIDESTKRSIGTVDDAFVAAGMPPGATVVMAGRNWRVLEIEPEKQRVRVAPAKDLGAIPQWSGSQLPVSYELAQAVARLRGAIAAGDKDPMLGPAAEPVHEQIAQGLKVPTDKRVTLEAGRGTVVANIALGTRGNEALGRVTAALIHQRAGTPCGMRSDAYRIHFTPPSGYGAADIREVWDSLESDTLDILMGLVLRDQPVVRHHLVHVAKHFGALPPTLDPNRFSRAKLDALFDRLALQEETLSRLLYDRFDLPAVQGFLGRLRSGELDVVHQALGPISRLGEDEARTMVSPPKTDEKLLAAVRKRIEQTDVMLLCTSCYSRLDMTVADVPKQVRCRRCGANAMACLRPWQEDQIPLLKADRRTIPKEQRLEADRLRKNGHLMGSFGATAARCLAARGVGADTAGRILQKVSDPESPAFWRELLQAELTFARTHAYWRR